MGDQKGQLQPTNSSHSTGSSSTFRSAFPAGSLDPPGISPAAKVYIRPASGKRPKKPSALDKHLRHVVLLQRPNRHASHQHAATAQQKHKQHQRFLNWGHRLRKAILNRGSSPEPEQHSTAPAQTIAGHDCSSPQQHDDSSVDIIQTWKPVAAAAQTRELQENLRKQENRMSRQLPRVLDPNTLRLDYHVQQQQLLQMQDEKGYSTALYSTIGKTAEQAAARQLSPAKGHTKAPGAGTAAAGQHAGHHNDQEGLLDVDAFLDGLLQTASTQQASAQPAAAAGTLSTNTAKQHFPACSQPQHDSQEQQPHSQHISSSLSQKQRRTSPQQRLGSRGRSMPAWVVSEQAAAAAKAAAAEEEEELLLQFAEGLEWQELLQDLGDDDLAAAFKELELADSAAAEGRPNADKRWQQCFVTALNAAAMKGIADTDRVAEGDGSQQGDKHSSASSASVLRRAEAAAARRQQLLHRLHRLTGTQPSSAAAAGNPLGPGAGSGSVKAGSVCGSTGSRMSLGNYSSLAAAAAAHDAGNWDSSTVVSSSGEHVGRLWSAIKHIEAGEVLAENPDMNGVHSTASVRSMLIRMDTFAA